MKILRKIMKILGILLLIIVLISIITGILNRNFIKSKKEYVDYLKNNKVDISFSQKQEDLNIEIADFYLLGENHGLKDVQKLDEKMIFYLNKKYGVTYYVAEMSNKMASQLNQYLLNEKGENTALLRRTIHELSKRIPQQASQEYYEKWRNIRKYNMTRRPEDKIEVIGVDVSGPSMTIRRDSIMYRNFIEAYNAIPNKENAKFYGLFGHAHILQDKLLGNIEPFAYRLKQNKLKVISIASYAIDSYTYLPDSDRYPKVPDNKSKWFNMNGPLFYLSGINDLIESSDTERSVLFKLNANDSPYLFDTRLINIRNLIGKNISPYNSKSTLNYIQYAVLIKKSESLSPLKLK